MQKTKTIVQYEEQSFRVTLVITRIGKAYTDTRYRPSDEDKIKFTLHE